jgi:hypothetical protein
VISEERIKQLVSEGKITKDQGLQALDLVRPTPAPKVIQPLKVI